MRGPIGLGGAALVSAMAMAALASGCADNTEFRNAPPALSSVTIPVPTGGGRTTAMSVQDGVGVSAEPLLGQTSEFYGMTVGISTGVNGSALALLGLLEAIVSQPPTTATLTARTWGPWTPGGLDPLTYRSEVVRTAAGHYTFSIDARARASMADADFLPMLDGEITKGLAPGVEKGAMTVHFDNRQKLPGITCDAGTIVFTFDTTQAPATTLDVSFTGAANTCKKETPTDATYHYERQAGGAGDFVFSLKTNFNRPDENKPLLESVKIRSRWQADGQGRSDLIVTGGEVQQDLMAAKLGTTVDGSQCWDTSFATIYETSTPAQLNLTPNDGDATKCVYTSAMLPE